MTARAKFTTADVRRAVAGVMAAGLPIGTVRIDPAGHIEVNVLPAKGKQAHDNDEWADLA